MKLFYLIIILTGLLSCTTSSIKNEMPFSSVVDEMIQPFSVAVKFESDVDRDDLAYWEKFFIKGLRYGVGIVAKDGQLNPRVIVSKKRTKCKIRVKYKDDQNSFSSWKTWVSGASLGLIPIKFKAQYYVNIVNSTGRTIQYENTIETWRHTLILPLIFLATSKQYATTAIGDEVYQRSREHCGK